MPVPDSVFGDMRVMSDSALRALLGLIRLSFRFDPEECQWVKPGRTFSRAAIQAECGLSGQGTRNGLDELESEGYVSIDRSGRGYEHRLLVGVPSSCYTYVPTDLFEEASGLAGTELRFVFAVLRATWGWTTGSTETGSGAPEHRRWAQLSMRVLSKLTGRSASAVKQAAQKLQGTWLQRRRPTSGAFYYRFRSERLTTEQAPDEGESQGTEPTLKKREEAVFSMGVPNDLPPDRQQSGPPRRGRIERFSKRRAHHSANSERPENTQEESPSRSGDSAVRGGKTPSQSSPRRSAPKSRPQKSRPNRDSHRGPRKTGPKNGEEIDLTGFSDRKRALGQKLANAGVWPRRIPELLARYSADRIEANFQLNRKRAEQVRESGAWLAAAIEEGFALPSPPEGSPSEPSAETSPDGEDSAKGRSKAGLPAPGTKVSDIRKRKLLETGLATEADFDRFADYDDPTCKQHFFRVDKTPSPAARP